jgi:hypothetical protein
MTPKQFFFTVFCFVLLVSGVVMVTLKWKGNSFYIRPYQAVDAKVKQQRGNARSTQEPSAPGFKESDIRKARGDGFSTY